MRRKIEYIDKCKKDALKGIRNNIYSQTDDNHTLVINDNHNDADLAKLIKRNSIVINQEVSNK